MSQVEYDIDEGLYELYLNWCRARNEQPSIKDFLVWKDEQGYFDDDPADYDWGDIND